MTPELANLPEDSEALKAMVRSLLLERDRETQRAEQQERRAEELRVEMLRLQLELERFKKWYYGPRADRLQSSGEMAQMLLAFGEELDRRPVHPDNLPPAAEPAEESRCVRRRKGRRNLADFENIVLLANHIGLRIRTLNEDRGRHAYGGRLPRHRPRAPVSAINRG